MFQDVLFLLKKKYYTEKSNIDIFSPRSGPSVNDVTPRRCDGSHGINNNCYIILMLKTSMEV